MIENNQNTSMPENPKAEETAKTENKVEPAKEKKSFFKYIRKRWKGLLILLLILICGAMYAWRTTTINQMKKQFTKDSLMIIAKTQEFIKQKDSTYLRLVTTTFSWAVRGEITRGNQEQVNQYVNTLVKYPNFSDILIANNDGKVIVSSNKKYESTNLNDFFAFNYLNLSDVTVIQHPEDKDLFVGLSPIMNLNSKIGTLLFTFKASKVIY